MSITERMLWEKVGPQLNARGLAYRIETANAPGFSDVIWFTKDETILIELKAGPLVFRPAQKLFIRQMHQLDVPNLCIWRRKKEEPPKVYHAIHLINREGVKSNNGLGVPFKDWIRAYDMFLNKPSIPLSEEDPDT